MWVLRGALCGLTALWSLLPPAGHWGCWRRCPHLPRGCQPGGCSETGAGAPQSLQLPSDFGFQVDLALDLPSWGENTAVRNRLVFPTLKAPELGPGAPSGWAVGVRAELVEEVDWEQFWGSHLWDRAPVCRGRRRVLARFQTGDTTGPCSLQTVGSGPTLSSQHSVLCPTQAGQLRASLPTGTCHARQEPPRHTGGSCQLHVGGFLFFVG